MASPRLSSARLEHWLQHAAEPAFWVSADLKLAWVNRAWEELTGHPSGDVLGLPLGAHGPAQSGGLDGVGGSFYPPHEALAGKPVASRTLIVHPAGERRWRRVEYWPFHNDKGERSVILGLVHGLDDASVSADSESHRLRAELMEVRERHIARLGAEGPIGRGPAHRRLMDQIRAAAASSVPVLVVGEAGTGKRLVARTIHQLGPGRGSPIVPIDCAALPVEMLERTLFGHPYSSEDGAPGFDRLTLPEGSTLLIGDVLDLPADLQVRLAGCLRGATARLIGVTATDPVDALRAERLRPDLYYALTTLVIRLSPLRERLDEVTLLAQHFRERANSRGVRQRNGFAPEALRTLAGYDWPGNVRELSRVVEDAHPRGDDGLIADADLPAGIRGNLGGAYSPTPGPPAGVPLDELLMQVERKIIENALVRARHNKSRAAEILGISRPRLYRRIKELSLPDEPEAAEDAASHETPGRPDSPV